MLQDPTLPEVCEVARLLDTENGMVVAKDWGQQELFDGQSVSVVKDEEGLEGCCTSTCL